MTTDTTPAIDAGTAEAATTEPIHEVDLALLHESPYQRRRDYGDLQGLADNMQQVGGILSPLLARPHVLSTVHSPLNPDNWARLEIVFGHRRYRAAKIAGLATAPVRVRVMTDAEAHLALITENVQREDVKPFEEAEGYHALMTEGKLTAAEVGAMVGMSASHILARVKLLQACPAVRRAAEEGSIQTEVALLLARLHGGEKVQEKALAAIKSDNIEITDGGQKSYRAIRYLLAEKFTGKLSEAIFSRDDPTLLPAAGACATCPKRTGNAPEYQDLVDGYTGKWPGHRVGGSAQLCTDLDCFDAKKTAHLRRKAEELRAKGKTVIDGNKARQAIDARGELKEGYVSVDKVKQMMGDELFKAAAPEPVVVQNPRDGKTVNAFRESDLIATGVMKPKAKSKAGTAAKQRDAHAEQQARENAKRKAAEEEAQLLTIQHTTLLHHVRAAAAQRARDAFDLRLVCAAALAGVQYRARTTLARLYSVREFDQLYKRLDAMNVDQLALLAMDCALVDAVEVTSYSLTSKPIELLGLARHYGLDARAIMDASLPAPSPSAAAAASTTTPKGGAGAGKKGKGAAAAASGKKTKKVKDEASAGADAKVTDEGGSAAGGSSAEDLFAATEGAS